MCGLTVLKQQQFSRSTRTHPSSLLPDDRMPLLSFPSASASSRLLLADAAVESHLLPCRPYLSFFPVRLLVAFASA